MRFEHNMRGQTVAINYGTTPQGPFIWVELEDGSPALDLTPEEEMETCRLAKQHSAQQNTSADQALDPLVAEFVRLVANHVQHLPEPARSDRLRALAAAIDDPAPDRTGRMMNVLFPQGGAA